MGRKKIQIKPISDEKTRLVTFAKRKNGLFKKAYELSVLCQCEIAIMVFTKSNRLHQYASKTMENALRRREAHARANEFCSNADMARWVTQRENGGGRSSALADSGTQDRGTDTLLVEESFDDSDIDVSSEEPSYPNRGSPNLESDTFSRLIGAQPSGVFQPQLTSCTNPTRVQDSSSSSDTFCTGDPMDNSKVVEGSIGLAAANGDLVNAAPSASAVATTLAYLHSQYPTTFPPTLGANISGLANIQSTPEEKNDEHMEDVTGRQSLICLDSDSAHRLDAPMSSNHSSSTNPMLVHLTTGDCSTTNSVPDDHRSLASLLLNERRDSCTRPNNSSDKNGLLRSGVDDRAGGCESLSFGINREANSNAVQQISHPTISVSVDTSDIKLDDTSVESRWSISSPSVASSFSSGSTVTTTVISAGSSGEVKPRFDGKPLTRGLSSLGAGRHKRFPTLSQLKMPATNSSSLLLSSSNSSVGSGSTGPGRLPQGTFLPTPEVESVLKNLETSRAPVTTTLDAVRSLDSQVGSAYPLDLRLTPPVPTAHASQQAIDPFSAMRLATAGGHLTSVPLPTTPTTPNPPLLHLSTTGDSILTNSLASSFTSSDSTQRCGFRAVKRNKLS